MKTTLTYFFLVFAINALYSQSISLPYYTGFDSPTEQAGWQQFRTGFLSSYDWSNNGSISHDYNVGGNFTDTVIDWYVSPSLKFTSSGIITMKVLTEGFSTPTSDNCVVWFGTNDPDPSSGNFVLIGNLSFMQPHGQWIDTTINVPFVSDSGYVAFKYKTIGAAWMTYSIDSITVSSTKVGIDETKFFNETIESVFPNPLISEATIYFDSEIKDGQLHLYNMHGQRVKSVSNITANKYQLYRGDLAAGVYVMILSINNTILLKKKLLVGNKIKN